MLPAATAGDVLVSRRFPQDDLPGMPGRAWDFGDGVAFAHGDHGAVFTLRGGRAGFAIEPNTRIRDVVVAGTFTTYDPGAVFGLMARVQPLGAAVTYYLADLDPAARWARVVRRCATVETAGEKVILATTSPAIAPPGAPNHVTFALVGASLRLFVNLELVIAAHDPVYGIGGAGMLVARSIPRDGGESRLAVHEFEISAVAE